MRHGEEHVFARIEPPFGAATPASMLID